MSDTSNTAPVLEDVVFDLDAHSVNHKSKEFESTISILSGALKSADAISSCMSGLAYSCISSAPIFGSLR